MRKIMDKKVARVLLGVALVLAIVTAGVSAYFVVNRDGDTKAGSGNVVLRNELRCVFTINDEQLLGVRPSRLQATIFTALSEYQKENFGPGISTNLMLTRIREASHVMADLGNADMRFSFSSFIVQAGESSFTSSYGITSSTDVIRIDKMYEEYFASLGITFNVVRPTLKCGHKGTVAGVVVRMDAKAILADLGIIHQASLPNLVFAAFYSNVRPFMETTCLCSCNSITQPFAQ